MQTQYQGRRWGKTLALRLFVLSLALLGVSSFTSSQPPSKQCYKLSQRGRLHMSFFDDVRSFFDEFGDDNNKNGDADPDLAAGTCRISTIPVRQIKPGGLRLFLMFYLMGAQNTPEKGSWRADQPTTEEYIVDFFFHDRTAALSVSLVEDEITIDRVGSTPSTAYMMQETVVLQGILAELQEIAFDDSVEEENRLLILPEPQDAIEKARDALSFA